LVPQGCWAINRAASSDGVDLDDQSVDLVGCRLTALAAAYQTFAEPGFLSEQAVSNIYISALVRDYINSALPDLRQVLCSTRQGILALLNQASIIFRPPRKMEGPALLKNVSRITPLFGVEYRQ
jgi:hypothetical protein